MTFNSTNIITTHYYRNSNYFMGRLVLLLLKDPNIAVTSNYQDMASHCNPSLLEVINRKNLHNNYYSFGFIAIFGWILFTIMSTNSTPKGIYLIIIIYSILALNYSVVF